MKAQGLPVPASPAPHAEPALPPPAAAASSQLDEALRGMLQPRTSGEGGIRRHRHGSAIHTHHNPAPRHAATTALQVRPAATDEAEAAPEGDDPPALADDAGLTPARTTTTATRHARTLRMAESSFFVGRESLLGIGLVVRCLP